MKNRKRSLDQLMNYQLPSNQMKGIKGGTGDGKIEIAVEKLEVVL